MKQAAKENLNQLHDMVRKISGETYRKEAEVFSGATVGQHTRHILEFYLILISGTFSDTLCYDKRKRDARMENDPTVALSAIEKVLAAIDTLKENQVLKFEANFNTDCSTSIQTTSSVGRELAYCIEHSIHHQALIKAGLISLGFKHIVDANFGVAYSTLRYKNSKCVQ